VPQRYNSPISVEWHPLAEVNLLRWPDGRFRKTRNYFGYTILVLIITGGFNRKNKRPTLLLRGKVDLLRLMKGHGLVLGAASQARLLSLVSSPFSR
jgi:hypothetical protein